jgi:serine protease Do
MFRAVARWATLTGYIVRQLLLLLWAIVAFPAAAEPTPAAPFAGSVVKIRAVAVEGVVRFGSAVVIGVDTLATACHVTRDATSIEVSHGHERWIAEAQVGSLANDLCLLTVRGTQLPVVPVRPSTDLRLGERVVAAGFPGGRGMVANEGVVEGLYSHDEGRVIRTSAAFDFGASGGGLFDDAGNLIGFLSFKGRTGGSLYFALPSEWAQPGNFVASKLVPIQNTSEPRAFWELAKDCRPSFLGTALMEAGQ